MIDDGGFAFCEKDDEVFYNPLQDEGINYNGLLIEVNGLIEELEKLGLNVVDIRKEVENIEQGVNDQVKYNYDTWDEGRGDSEALQGGLRLGYQDAKKRLDYLRTDLKLKWQDYYIITNNCDEIENILRNLGSVDFNQAIDKLIDTLKKMRESSTIDNNMEIGIVYRLYKIIYFVMKMEIVFTNNTRLLNYIKKDETDSIYIASLLKEEIKGIKNEDVLAAVSSLKREGMDSTNLLDEKLILLVTIARNDEAMSVIEKRCTVNRKELEELIKNIEKNEELLQGFKEDFRNIDKGIEDLKKRKKSKTLKGIINGVIIAVCLTSSVLAAKKFGKVKEYYTTTTTYDSVTDSSTTTYGYEPGDEDEMTIQECTPWVDASPLRNTDYEREVFDYNVPKEDIGLHSDLRQYLDPETAKQYDYKSKKPQTEKEKPEDYGYVGNKYTITKKEKDLDKVHERDDKVLFGILLGVYLAATAKIELIYLKRIDKDRYTIIKKEMKCALDKKEEKERAIMELEARLDELNKEKEKLKRVLEDDTNILTKLTKNDKESKDDNPELVLTV